MLFKASVETPPRAWGRVYLATIICVGGGNTPTGVGKSGFPRNAYPLPGKHPHGRREEKNKEMKDDERGETPPRAWGRVISFSALIFILGNIPTGVGKSLDFAEWTRKGWKHPHGRGEESARSKGQVSVTETPPRAWGRVAILQSSLFFFRNTPTGVGKR